MHPRDEQLDFDLAEVAAVEPSPEVKARLLASSGGGRFSTYAEPIATMFEVSVDRAHELLGLIERSASWQTKLPGVEVLAFRGGPALLGADCAFLRIAPGGMFPSHTHVGDESAIVLTGQVRDVTHARSFAPGDSWQLAAGTRHKLMGEGAEVCICAVCARDGIVFGGAAR